MTPQERSAREATFPKCRCGNTAQKDKPTCRRCGDQDHAAQEDDRFLYDLSDRLGVSKYDLERLIEIAKK